MQHGGSAQSDPRLDRATPRRQASAEAKMDERQSKKRRTRAPFKNRPVFSQARLCLVVRGSLLDERNQDGRAGNPGYRHTDHNQGEKRRMRRGQRMQ